MPIRETSLLGRLQWWPSALALALALFIVPDLSPETPLAAILAASALIYLAAAAFGRPGIGWPAFVAAFAVIAASSSDILPEATWVLLAIGSLLAICGWAGLSRGKLAELRTQSIGMLMFGGVAAAALALGPQTGALLVAAGLLGHGAWDAVHHWRNCAVDRSLAEFCCLLDLTVGSAILVSALA